MGKHGIKTYKIVFFAALLWSLALPLCTDSAGPIVGGTLIFGRGGDSVGLDPAHEEDGESFKVCGAIYDTLIQYKDESTEVEPALASSWEASSDGLSWTFHLRKNVKFHDGTPFDAEAVLFSLNRQHNPTHAFHNVGGPYIYWSDTGLAEIVDEITALDRFTIQITLTRPYAPFIYTIAMTPFSIVSPSSARESLENFTNRPVGTGPFKFVRWDRGDKVVLEVNHDYWGGRPPLDRIIFRSIPDNSVRLIELQNGSIDAMEFPNPDDLPQIREDTQLEIVEQPGMNVGYLAMNMDRKPFDNLKIRRAINHAINKHEIIKQLYQGMGIPAKNPIPPTMWSYDDSIEEYTYNPDKAKQLLKEAGYPEGFETTLWALPVPRPYIPAGRLLAAIIQSDLRRIGIIGKIVTYDWGTYLEKTKYGEHDMAMLGWSADIGDPDNFFYYLLSKEAAQKPAGNISFYRSDEMQEILVQAQSATNQAERIELYKKAQRIFHRDIPWVPLAHAKQIVIINKRVKNLKLHPTTWKYFRQIWLEQ